MFDSSEGGDNCYIIEHLIQNCMLKKHCGLGTSHNPLT